MAFQPARANGDANAFFHGLIAFVAAITARDVVPSALDALRLHALDAVAAMRAGGRTSETAATSAVVRRLAPSAGIATTAAMLAIACRSTECDDIDLPSCTTPGSVVLPAALAAAELGHVSRSAFIEGVIAGYEVMTAVGLAADGASIVYGRQWPTYLCAAVTVAATVGKALGLSEGRLRHALAIAASMTTGSAGRIAADPTSRWLTLGYAVQAGIAAAVGAHDGLQGDEAIFASCFDLDPGRLRSREKGPFWALERVALKPYHTGRQGLSAIEAFAALVADEALDVASIAGIAVIVPEQVRAMIDRTKEPRTKVESRGIHYQLALSVLHPDDLFDLERRTLRTTDPAMAALMNCVTVRSSDAFTALYPRAWPGSVVVATRTGTFARSVLHPRGDVENPLPWNTVEAKWVAIFRHLGETLPMITVATAVQNLDVAALSAIVKNAPEPPG